MNIYPPVDWTKHPLHTAAMSGNKTEVERLITQRADVNENVGLAATPLHVAICHCLGDDPSFKYQGHVEVIEVLLANGANLHARRVYEGTPLHDAARKGFIHIAELLISQGADVNSKEEDHRRTPLHRAVAEGRLQMVNYLLSRGANGNAAADFKPHPQDARIYPDIGLTPLHLAAREGFVEIAQMLIDAGALVDAPSLEPQGITALDLAVLSERQIEAKYDKIIELLTSRGSEYP